MPTIHLLKEGLKENGEHLTWSVEASSEEVENHFSQVNKLFSKDPPTVNPDTVASEWAEYRHIVVEVEGDEPSDSFPDPGYYLLKNVSPREYRNVFSGRLPVV